MAGITMVYRFEKILLIALITIFGILPMVAYPVFNSLAPKAVSGPSETTDVFIASSALEQLAAVATAFVVKPVYTLIALIVAIVLRKKTDMELKALKWAMLFFFIGENFCAANFLFTQNHDSHLLEYLHSLGMVLSFGFAAFALMEGTDRYALHFSDIKKSCALAGFCRQCHKFEEVSCGLQSALIFFGIAGAVVALMPLGAQLHIVSYNTSIWGAPYTYKHPVVYQLAEIRYYPLLASALFLAASLTLWLKQDNSLHPSKLLFAAAIGVMGFSFFRFIVFQGFRTRLVWMDFWEEITELLYIAAVVAILCYFRRSFFGRQATSDSSEQHHR
jgi:hypothetical protein